VISLVLSMIWTRRGQAVTLGLLALFAVAAAVASPAYLTAADRAVAAGQIATATAAEHGLVISGAQNERRDPTNNSTALIDFDNVGAALVSLPGFTYVYSAEFPAIGIEKSLKNADRFVFRQDVCSHVRMTTGRCPVSAGEVIIGVATARRLGLAAGDLVTMQAGKYSDEQRVPGYRADGKPKKLVVAGTYQVTTPTETYWGTHSYFTAVPGLGPGEPVFTDAATFDAIDHGDTVVSIDGTAGPQALNPDHLDQLRAGLANLNNSSTQLGASIQITTQLPALLDRIDQGRSAAGLLVPVLAVPLVLLACFSIFLAVGYGTQGRQPELAVVALRGARWWMRWWLATGENLAAVLVGAIAGCVAGQLLVNAIASARFPGVGVEAGWDSLQYAPIAALAALLAAVLAQRRQLLRPVATLLRRNPVVADGPRALATEAVVVLLAVVAVVQLVISGGTLTGVGLLAPAFLVLAVAVVAARLSLPLVTRWATRALDRGNVGVALAGLQLSRRPGAQRLFALLVATVAVVGYAACAVDVADGGRQVQAGVGVGAARVLDVNATFRSQLLSAVRAVDPQGRYAMAVVHLPSSAHNESPALAVDSTRLAAVASWPSGGPSAGEIATRLRPAAPDPTVFAGQDVTVDATASGLDPDKGMRLDLAVSSTAGLGDTLIQLGTIHPGRFTYQERVPVCAKGCRLNGIEIEAGATATGITAEVVINSLRTVNPPAVAAPPAQLADPARWRMSRYGQIAAGPDGLRITLNGAGGLPGGAWVTPIDAPYPLPVAYAGPAPIAGSITGAGGGPLPVTTVGRLAAIPELGDRATLVDLEWADRLATDAGQALQPQVWLNAHAPADIVDRLAEQGVTVVSDTRSDQVRQQLEQQGPALSLWFYLLAAALAVLLGAGALVLAAAVDRARRVEDLSALRGQGLSRSRVGWATLWTYPILVAIAAVVGLLTALIAWLATGWALPLSGIDPPSLPLPSWPGPLSVGGATVAVFLILAAVAAATGRDLRRRVFSPGD
jgi:putative ABC transport system permease protein